jgi:hypothetical protein
VFVLAVGWRTGSTLVQRVLSTDRRLLLWGEPFGRLALIPRMAEAMTAITPSWPRESRYFLQDDRSVDLVTDWIANLFPEPGSLRDGLRSFVRRWLGDPARARGYARWGAKDVRLGGGEAVLLHWLFPSARFVVPVRDPVDAYRSAKPVTLWQRWPDQPVDGVRSFARHWNDLATSWEHVPAGFPSTIVRFEDVVARAVDFAAVGRELGLQLDPEEALSLRIGGPNRPESPRVNAVERAVIRRATRAGRKAHGYGG